MQNVNNLSVGAIITGRKRRLGFGKRGKNSFTVQRSEEVVPGEMRGGMSGVSRASSASSENDEDRFAVFGTVDIDTIVWHLARGGRSLAYRHFHDTKVAKKRQRGHLHKDVELCSNSMLYNAIRQINMLCRLCKVS